MYYIKYYLPNQSEETSKPKYYETKEQDNFFDAIVMGSTHGYKIVGCGYYDKE